MKDFSRYAKEYKAARLAVDNELPAVLKYFVLAEATSRTEVTVAPLTDAQVAAYIASGECFGKAGAYAIQGRFAAWVPHLSGSHSGVMGLPMHETASLLRAFGLFD